MSLMGLGRVKTPTFNLRVEIPSRFRKFENQKCLRPLLREDDRENNSAHSWLVHVFTQPGSKADLKQRMFDVRTFLNSGHSSGRRQCQLVPPTGDLARAARPRLAEHRYTSHISRPWCCRLKDPIPSRNVNPDAGVDRRRPWKHSRHIST